MGSITPARGRLLIIRETSYLPTIIGRAASFTCSRYRSRRSRAAVTIFGSKCATIASAGGRAFGTCFPAGTRFHRTGACTQGKCACTQAAGARPRGRCARTHAKRARTRGPGERTRTTGACTCLLGARTRALRARTDCECDAPDTRPLVSFNFAGWVSAHVPASR
jgi:hypothetical protein